MFWFLSSPHSLHVNISRQDVCAHAPLVTTIGKKKRILAVFLHSQRPPVQKYGVRKKTQEETNNPPGVRGDPAATESPERCVPHATWEFGSWASEGDGTKFYLTPIHDLIYVTLELEWLELIDISLSW